LLVGKPGGRRPLGRPRGRWVDNMKIDLGEIGWGDVDWIGLAQDREKFRDLESKVMKLRVLQMLGNYPVAKQLVASRVGLTSIELAS
jgi:hypothetical protein